MKRLGIMMVFSLIVAGCGKDTKKIKPKKNKLLFEDEAVAKRKQRAQLTTGGTSGRQVIDYFLARVNGVNILASDLEEPRIEKNCGKNTLEELINEELLYQKALEMKMSPNELDVERRFVSIKDHNGFAHQSDEAFEKWFKKESGLSIRKLKRQLMRAGAIDNVKNMYVQDKCFISPQKIEQYWTANPEYHQEKYELKSAFVDKDQLNDAGFIIDESTLSWIDLGWIEKSAITENMIFVTRLEKGEVSKVVETDNGLQVFKLEDRKPSALKLIEERYNDIEKKLLFAERENLEKELIAQLRSRASLVYLQ